MANGLWATWYNLDEDSRDEFKEWADAEFFPSLRALDGVAWVANYCNEGGGPRMDEYVKNVVGKTDEDIGDGRDYALLIGTTSAHTLFRPAVLDRSWPSKSLGMQALMRGRRGAFFVEEARVNGPASGFTTSGGAPGPYIQLGSFRMATVEKDFELTKWYAQHRLPYMARMKGCIAATKYAGVSGWAKHCILYEFASAEDRMQHFEIEHETHVADASAWYANVTQYTLHAPGSPLIGPRLWPSS